MGQPHVRKSLIWRSLGFAAVGLLDDLEGPLLAPTMSDPLTQPLAAVAVVVAVAVAPAKLVSLVFGALVPPKSSWKFGWPQLRSSLLRGGQENVSKSYQCMWLRERPKHTLRRTMIHWAQMPRQSFRNLSKNVAVLVRLNEACGEGRGPKCAQRICKAFGAV